MAWDVSLPWINERPHITAAQYAVLPSGLADLNVASNGPWAPSTDVADPIAGIFGKSQPVMKWSGTSSTTNQYWYPINGNYLGAQHGGICAFYKIAPTFGGVLLSLGESYTPSTALVASWLSKKSGSSTELTFETNVNGTVGGFYSYTFDPEDGTHPHIHANDWHKFMLAYGNWNGTNWTMRLYMDDVLIHEFNYSNCGSVIPSANGHNGAGFIYQVGWGTGDAQTVYSAHEYLYYPRIGGAGTLTSAHETSQRFYITGQVLPSTAPTGWDTTNGTGSIIDGSTTTGVEQAASTGGYAVSPTPVTTGTSLGSIDFDKLAGLWGGHSSTHGAPNGIGFSAGGVLLSRGNGGQTDKDVRARDGASNTVSLLSGISLTSGTWSWHRPLGTGGGNPQTTYYLNDNGPGPWWVNHNSSGANTLWSEGYLILVVSLHSQVDIRAVGSVSIAGATVTQGVQEHFTSLAVNATASTTVATPLKAATTSLASSATGAVTIAGAARGVTAGPLAVDATGAITIAASTRNAVSGPLAVDATGAIIVATPSHEVLGSALAINATGAVTIAASTRGVISGALAIDATGNIVIVDATVTPGFTEHFTSLTVDAIASIVLGTPLKDAFADPLAINATGGVLLGTPLKQAFTSLTQDATGLVTLGTPLLEAFTTLTVDASGAVTLGTPLKEAFTLLTVDATGAITIAGAFVGTEILMGPFVLSATGTLDIAATSHEAFATSAVSSVGDIVISTPLMETTAGPIAVDGSGLITISAATLERLIGQLNLDATSAVIIGTPLKEAFTTIASAGIGDIIIATPLNETFPGALAIDATGLITIANATVGGDTSQLIIWIY